jgi:hypothetical protein
MLAPYRDNANRITLLKAANPSVEYESLGLPQKELRSVFMSNFIEDSATASVGPDKLVCTHFFKVLSSQFDAAPNFG